MSNARKLADNLPSEGQLGGRNIVINGEINVNQRGNLTGLTAASYGPDRWNFTLSGRDELVYSLAQDSDSPSGSGFTSSLKYTTTTAESSIPSDEYYFLGQRIEAQNLKHLCYGTSSAKKLTLSFWVKSTITGTFCVGLYKEDNTNYFHNKTYTISSASTWEYKTITFEANTLTGGAIDNDNGLGFYLSWHLAAGSNYDSGSSTSSGWAVYSTNKWCEPNTTDAVITTTNATFQLTGVQLEVGPQSTPFEHEPFEATLSKAQRYYAEAGFVAADSAPSRYYNTINLPVEMRTKPTLTTGGIDNGSGATLNWTWDNTETFNSKRNFYQGTANSAISSAWFKFDAEL